MPQATERAQFLFMGKAFYQSADLGVEWGVNTERVCQSGNPPAKPNLFVSSQTLDLPVCELWTAPGSLCCPVWRVCNVSIFTPEGAELGNLPIILCF